jgi:MFS family permease
VETIERESSHQVVLGTLSLGNFAQIGARFVLSPVVPLVILEYDVTKASVGLVLTGMWAVYGLSQFPSGVLADRYGERRILFMGIASTATGSALIALAPAFSIFVMFALLLGIGAGLFFTPGASLLSTLFEDDGKALGVFTAAAAAAGVVYPAVGGFVGGSIGWRYAVGVSALVPIPIALAILLWIPAPSAGTPTEGPSTIVDLGRIRSLLGRPGVIYSILLAVMFGFVFQAITSFLPTFLQEYHGLTTGMAGLTFGIMFALSAIVQPVTGAFSDRTSRDVALGITALTTGTAILILLFIPGLTAVLLGTIVLGTGMSWPGVLQARLMDQLPEDRRGFGFGFMRTVYMFFAAAGSVVVGTIADQGGWQLGYGSIAALLCVTIVILASGAVYRRWE